MIPVSLFLKNFMPYRDTSLNFDGLHVACLTGDNGAGKSSILDAITWSVWGRARSNRDDDLVFLGQTDMQVEFTFKLGAQLYRTIRSRKSGKKSGAGSLDFQTSIDGATWRTLAEPQMIATQKKIIEILRLDYETFINSAFLLQGHADEFTVKTPAERKKVLADILGLSAWESWESDAKAKIATVDLNLKIIDGRLGSIDAGIALRGQYLTELTAAEVALSKSGADLERFDAAVQLARKSAAALDQLVDSLNEIDRRIHQDNAEVSLARTALTTATRKAQSTELAASLAAVKTSLLALGDVDQNRAALGLERDKALAKVSELKGQNAQLGPMTEPIKARIAQLQASTDPACPTCGQALSDEHRQSVIAGLNVEIQANRTAYAANLIAMKRNQVEADRLTAEIAEIDRALKTKSDLVRREAELESAITVFAEAATTLPDLQTRLDNWTQLGAQHQAERATVVDQIAVAKRDGGDLQQVESDYAQARRQESQARQVLGATQERLAQCDALEQQRQEVVSGRNNLARQRGLYDELKVAFGKKGVPAMLIDSAIPEIEDEANDLLTRITGGRMHVRFDTQRESVKGDAIETLDIKIADELGTRPYEMYSGGEAFRVNFAIRIALSKLLSRRAGAQLQTLVIDEGFGALDSAGRDQIVGAITAIQDDFERILVVTHLDELKDAFPARIEVTKTAQGSKIEVI